MPKVKLTGDVLALVAARFKVLAEPARLKIMNALRAGEKTVGGLVAVTGLSQANVSKHLQLLHATNFVRRRKKGLFVHYVLADRTAFHLCDLMCGHIAAQDAERRRLTRPAPAPAPPPSPPRRGRPARSA